jgi:hypothetical protein
MTDIIHSIIYWVGFTTILIITATLLAYLRLKLIDQVVEKDITNASDEEMEDIFKEVTK